MYTGPDLVTKCARCGYPISHLAPGELCPECGTAADGRIGNELVMWAMSALINPPETPIEEVVSELVGDLDLCRPGQRRWILDWMRAAARDERQGRGEILDRLIELGHQDLDWCNCHNSLLPLPDLFDRVIAASEAEA